MSSEVKYLFKIDLVIFLLGIVFSFIDTEIANKVFGNLFGAFSGFACATFIAEKFIWKD